MRWFGGPGQQGGPWEIPMELFIDRVAGLARDCERVLVLGTSFGAEAALLVTARTSMRWSCSPLPTSPWAGSAVTEARPLTGRSMVHLAALLMDPDKGRRIGVWLPVLIKRNERDRPWEPLEPTSLNGLSPGRRTAPRHRPSFQADGQVPPGRAKPGRFRPGSGHAPRDDRLPGARHSMCVYCVL